MSSNSKIDQKLENLEDETKPVTFEEWLAGQEELLKIARAANEVSRQASELSEASIEDEEAREVRKEKLAEFEALRKKYNDAKKNFRGFPQEEVTELMERQIMKITFELLLLSGKLHLTYFDDVPEIINDIEVDPDNPFQTEEFLENAFEMNAIWQRRNADYEDWIERISKWDPYGNDEFPMRRVNSLEAYPKTWDLIDYLEALYKPGEYVGFSTEDVWFNPKTGKWRPGKGDHSHTAAELIEGLEKHIDDIGATFGKWKDEAGAWIRINPTDGRGGKSENITAYRHVLVKSDELPPLEQLRLMRKWQLPIAAAVASADKSIHAVVKVDAANEREYNQRVQFLYDWLESHGLKMDRSNSTPNRMSRMPSVTRKGRVQRLLAINMGRRSWNDWMDFVEGEEDELPQLASLEELSEVPPELPEELIAGVLRQGHKMLISGSSKAGKSFLLMQLCIAIAEGRNWLGFPCRKGRVLYVNLEIDPASCVHRFLEIYRAMGLEPKNRGDIQIWNLRGHAVPLDKLVPRLVRRVKHQGLDAIVIDPIYKVITGDENSASEMAAFCNQFDRICEATGCSVIYCHHHSKGVQGQKRAMDRASGSGVFARDPDAQLDMIELELSDELKEKTKDSPVPVTAWRMESSLREFQNFKPVNFWFRFPLHYVEQNGELAKMPTQGSPEAGRMKNKKSKTADQATENFRKAYRALYEQHQKEPTVKEMAEYLHLSDKTIYDRAKKLENEFRAKGGVVYCLNNKGTQQPPRTMDWDDEISDD